MQTKYLSGNRANPPGLLRKAGVMIATTAAAVVVLMFSAVLLAAVLSIAVMAFTYLWWKTRGMRKQMKEQMRDFPPPGATMERETFRGEVIEGEAVRVDEPRDRIAR